MTYCVGVLLEGGMVFASNSRSDKADGDLPPIPGVTIYEQPGDRVICVMSAGRLSLARSVIDMLDRQAAQTGGGPNVWTAQSMFDVAGLLGDCLREARRDSAKGPEPDGADTHASFIIGGQIKGERQRLFMVYAAGNFIEATPETPFFQIGETKYGKPIIDRVIVPETGLGDAVKCVLISFDSTMRSNPSVGLPIDLCVSKKDALRVGVRHRIMETDRYFAALHEQWGHGLRRVFSQLPEPQWDETTS